MLKKIKIKDINQELLFINHQLYYLKNNKSNFSVLQKYFEQLLLNTCNIVQHKVKNIYDFVLNNHNTNNNKINLQKNTLKDKIFHKKIAIKRPKPVGFLINFKGDIQATAVEDLKLLISSVLDIMNNQDEIIINLESPGGILNEYGLAAAQLERIRMRNIPLTILIDRVAASGGYLMACIANKIVAAPLSLIGSIGIITQIPNIYEFLKQFKINIETFSTNVNKEGISLLGKPTEAARQEVRDDLNEYHKILKTFINKYRSNLDLDLVANGKVWLGNQALQLGLIDEINTSDEFILNKIKQGFQIFEIAIDHPKSWLIKLIKIIEWLNFNNDNDNDDD